MTDLVVRVDPSLAFLLPTRDRPTAERRLGFEPDATVGHVVRAAGVPPTEVGALTLDGAPVEPSAPLPGPAASLRVVGGSGVLRLLDVGLGSLGRRLRLLGLDAPYDSRADDAELVERARAEDRGLLTRTAGCSCAAPCRSVPWCAAPGRRVYWRGARARRIDELVARAR